MGRAPDSPSDNESYPSRAERFAMDALELWIESLPTFVYRMLVRLSTLYLVQHDPIDKPIDKLDGPLRLRYNKSSV
jgi:hypothetical protein